MNIGRIILVYIGILLAIRGVLFVVAAFNNPNVASKFFGSATFFILLSLLCFWLSKKFGEKE
jgi:uncharacterized membrane protein HdeD (DUF308 family)